MANEAFLSTDDLEIVSRVSLACSTDPRRGAIQGVRIARPKDALEAWATDGQILAIGRLRGSEARELAPFTIPPAAVEAIRKAFSWRKGEHRVKPACMPLRLWASDGEITMQAGDRKTSWQPEPGIYPDVTAVFPREISTMAAPVQADIRNLSRAMDILGETYAERGEPYTSRFAFQGPGAPLWAANCDVAVGVMPIVAGKGHRESDRGEDSRARVFGFFK
jgi:hypothetical protein